MKNSKEMDIEFIEVSSWTLVPNSVLNLDGKKPKNLFAPDRGRGLRHELSRTIKVRGKPKCPILTRTLFRQRERGIHYFHDSWVTTGHEGLVIEDRFWIVSGSRVKRKAVRYGHLMGDYGASCGNPKSGKGTRDPNSP